MFENPERTRTLPSSADAYDSQYLCFNHFILFSFPDDELSLFKSLKM